MGLSATAASMMVTMLPAETYCVVRMEPSVAKKVAMLFMLTPPDGSTKEMFPLPSLFGELMPVRVM